MSICCLVVSNMTTTDPPKALSAVFMAASRNPYLLECRFEALYWFKEAKHKEAKHDNQADDEDLYIPDLYIPDADIEDSCKFGYYLDRVKHLLLLPRSSQDKDALGYDDWKQTVYYMHDNNDYMYALCCRWITYSILMVEEGVKWNTQKEGPTKGWCPR